MNMLPQISGSHHLDINIKLHFTNLDCKRNLVLPQKRQRDQTIQPQNRSSAQDGFFSFIINTYQNDIQYFPSIPLCDQCVLPSLLRTCNIICQSLINAVLTVFAGSHHSRHVCPLATAPDVVITSPGIVGRTS